MLEPAGTLTPVQTFLQEAKQRIELAINQFATKEELISLIAYITPLAYKAGATEAELMTMFASVRQPEKFDDLLSSAPPSPVLGREEAEPQRITGDFIPDPFAYLKRLDVRIATGTAEQQTVARARRANLLALLEHLGSDVIAKIYEDFNHIDINPITGKPSVDKDGDPLPPDNTRFCARLQEKRGLKESDIPEDDKFYPHLRRGIKGAFIGSLTFGMLSQAFQAMVEAREDWNLSISTWIAITSGVGKGYFLYNVANDLHVKLALMAYDTKKNWKQKAGNTLSMIKEGTWNAGDIQGWIGFLAMTTPPALQFARLVPMAFDSYTQLVQKDGLTGPYVWASDNIAQSTAVRWISSVCSFNTNFLTVPVILHWGPKTVYGIIHDGKIAFAKPDDKLFHRSRYVASTTVGLGFFASLAQGFFNFYGLSQVIFGPFLGCAVYSAANDTMANVTVTYAAPVADAIAGYNLGYMELILLMASYKLGSETIKLVFDWIRGDVKLKDLPAYNTPKEEERFRLLPSIVLHLVSAAGTIAIVVPGFYPNLWQQRQAKLTSGYDRFTAAASSATTETEGTYKGLYALFVMFCNAVNCCCPGEQKKKNKSYKSFVEAVGDDEEVSAAKSASGGLVAITTGREEDTLLTKAPKVGNDNNEGALFGKKEAGCCARFWRSRRTETAPPIVDAPLLEPERTTAKTEKGCGIM